MGKAVDATGASLATPSQSSHSASFGATVLEIGGGIPAKVVAAGLVTTHDAEPAAAAYGSLSLRVGVAASPSTTASASAAPSVVAGSASTTTGGGGGGGAVGGGSVNVSRPDGGAGSQTPDAVAVLTERDLIDLFTVHMPSATDPLHVPALIVEVSATRTGNKYNLRHAFFSPTDVSPFSSPLTSHIPQSPSFTRHPFSLHTERVSGVMAVGQGRGVAHGAPHSHHRQLRGEG